MNYTELIFFIGLLEAMFLSIFVPGSVNKLKKYPKIWITRPATHDLGTVDVNSSR